MKSLISLIYLVTYISLAISQKYDNVWIYGQGMYNQVTNTFSGGRINFQSISPTVIQEDKPIAFYLTNAAICDSFGNLQLYTNGYFAYNGNNQMVQNGNYMCLGSSCYASDEQIGYNNPQAYLFLPKGNNNQKQYYLFQEVLDWIPLSTGGVTINNVRLLYSAIDMNIGQGKIIKKHQIIINDTIAIGQLTSVKHANGKDWWIIMPRVGTDTYYRVLVTADSVYIPQTQRLAPVLPNYHAGYAAFNPNGKQYIRYENGYLGDDRIYIYDFDRCTGLLSNPLIFKTYPLPNRYFYSLAISANSKYLYVGLGDKIDQYNISLPNANIESSRTTVFVRDTNYITPCDNTITHEYVSLCSALAPDNKIYFWNGCERFHVIQNPDSGELACNVQANAFSIPYTPYQLFSFTNYPNFRLGAEPCYPTEVEGVTEKENISLYPNPSHTNITLSGIAPAPNVRMLRVVNSFGQEVASYEIARDTQQFSFEVRKWTQGIYYAILEEKGKKIFATKFIVSE